LVFFSNISFPFLINTLGHRGLNPSVLSTALVA